MGDTVYYAIDKHDREDLSRPVPATHWFWQTGNRWVAVVGDWHEDWWEDADPKDIATRPDPWALPIEQVPPKGTLVYLHHNGDLCEVRRRIIGS